MGGRAEEFECPWFDHLLPHLHSRRRVFGGSFPDWRGVMALAMSESDMIWLLVRLLIILHYTTLHTLLHMHPHRHTHTHTLLNHNCTSPCLG
jgi:hypothetical protein